VNSVESGVRPRAADLQLASASEGPTSFACGTFSENIATAQFQAAGLQPTSPPVRAALCLRNVGAAPLVVTVGANGTLRDFDPTCTGDEATGDSTCGNNQVGELAGILKLDIIPIDCTSGQADANFSSIPLASLQTGGHSLRGAATLAAGAQWCFRFQVAYDPGTAEADIQVAQSDQVTWAFTFEGTA
jgi:hypothetical protein